MTLAQGSLRHLDIPCLIVDDLDFDRIFHLAWCQDDSTTLLTEALQGTNMFHSSIECVCPKALTLLGYDALVLNVPFAGDLTCTECEY